MTMLPDTPPDVPYRRPDRGDPTTALVAWVLVLVLTAVLVYDNQVQRPAQKAQPQTQAQTQAQAPARPALDQFEMAAKMLVKIEHTAMGNDPQVKTTIMANLDSSAQSDLDRFHAAIVGADVVGAEEAAKRLDSLDSAIDSRAADPAATAETAERDAALKADIALARGTLAEPPTAPGPDEREKFIKDHGWFARLLFARGQSDADPERAPLIKGGDQLLLLVFLALGVGFIAFFGGLTAFTIAAIKFFGGQRRWQGRRGTNVSIPVGGPWGGAFEAPAPGGSVYIETVAVFIGSFLLLRQVEKLIAAHFYGPKPTETELLNLSLIAQWAILPVIFWPLVRGVPWSEYRRQIGWHSGRGVFREIGAGIFAYFAGLPALAMAAIFTFIILVFKSALAKQHGETAAPPENPIVDVLLHAGALQYFLIFVLATVWAPIVEETVFRGALFRNLRTGLPLLGAAAISAFFFGVMHGYEYMLLLPVMTLGFVFALMRQWRGSLIASMTAHSLHNATIMTLAILLLTAIRD